MVNEMNQAQQNPNDFKIEMSNVEGVNIRVSKTVQPFFVIIVSSGFGFL